MGVVLVETAEQLTELRAAIWKAIQDGAWIGFDVETFGPYITHPKDRKKSKPDALRHRIVGYGISIAGRAWYVPLRAYVTSAGWHDAIARESTHIVNASARGRLLRFLEQPGAKVVCHNWAYETQVLANEGVTPRCVKLDSMLFAWMRGMRLPDPKGLKLKPLMEHYFNQRRPHFEDVMRGRLLPDVPPAEVAPYCGADCLDAVRLAERCWAEMSDEERTDYLELEAPTIDVAVHMQAVGVPIERELLKATGEEARQRMAALRERFTKLTETTVQLPVKVKRPKRCQGPAHWDGAAGAGGACAEPGCVAGILHFKNGNVKMETVMEDQPVLRGADIGSSDQVSRWCFEELKWWPTARHKRTREGSYSTKAEHIKPYITLAGPAGEAAALRLEYQGLSKYADLYTTGLITLADQWEDGRLHTSYLQTGTDTGRFSSAFPNISNIPRDGSKVGVPSVRGAFIAPPGWVCIMRDMSQAELRMLAHYSQDPKLLAVYRSADGDIHAVTMAGIGIQRPEAKITNFCQAPETRVLMADLTWKTSDRVAVGDRLVGFDESLGSQARYREAVVEGVQALRRPAYRVITTHGEMVASAEHRWVVRTPAGRCWVDTAALAAGDCLAFMAKPWDVDTSYGGGWLAGMFDGEGHLGARGQLGVAQNPGPLLERLKFELAKRDIPFTPSVNNAPGGCTQLLVHGDGAPLRAVGMLRPERMLAQPERLWLGRRACHPHAAPCYVLAVEPLGERDVIATQTSTGTLITEGFLTHNSCIYRITAKTLAVKLTFFTGRRWTEHEAQRLIDGFYTTYPYVETYHDKAIRIAEDRGYARSIGGFRMPLTEWEGRQRHHTQNRAINYPIQGSVATLLKRSLVGLYRLWSDMGVLGERVVIQGQTYDSVNVLARTDFAEQANEDMRRVMEACAPELSVPLKTDGGIGTSWATAK